MGSHGVRPPKLSPGDTVAVCTPGSPVTKDRLDAGVAALAERYEVRVSEHALDRDGYLAGTDDARAEELNRYFRDPDVRAIVLSRGGYGIMRILDRLDADALRRDPKIIVGYSDATALLAWALTAAGVRGIHGPMAAHFAQLPAGDRQWMISLMESTEPAGAMPENAGAIGAPASEPARGRLLGGNLCLLSHLLGTPHWIDTTGAILVIEDVGERPYAIDRYLTHLRLAGQLDSAAAVICGELVRCLPTVWQEGPSADRVVSERLEAAGVPGLGQLPIGHGDRNLAFPFGASAEVDFDSGQVRLLEAAVE